MTTYTITETERIYLMEHSKDMRALTVLQSLQPNTQEPVAYRYDFDGYYWKFIDNGRGNSWIERAATKKDAEPLYTHPAHGAKP